MVFSECYPISEELFLVIIGKTFPHFRYSLHNIHCYSAKIILFIIRILTDFVRFSWEISEISGNSDISGNSGKCREIFPGKIPGNFPPDFPVFSGDEAHVTAVILSFKKSKIKKISGNFGRKFPGNSGKFSPKTSGNFPRIFLCFFNWNVLLQP